MFNKTLARNWEEMREGRGRWYWLGVDLSESKALGRTMCIRSITQEGSERAVWGG